MGDVPRSLREFEARIPDDLACARWLMARRWPDGFRCPGCGHDHGWELGRRVVLIECARCHRQTSVTAGTVTHRRYLPLKVWFTAAWLMATHRNGISARQLWLQLGLGSHKSAWLLLTQLRRAMVDPGRAPLGGLVEVDEASIPLCTKDDPIAPKPGRSHDGKLLLAGAVEIVGKGPGRARLAVIVVDGHVHAGSTVFSDGWSGCGRLSGVEHDPKVVGPMAAHVLLSWIHRVFANAKRWALAVYRGLRAPHLQRYLDEFVLRFNRQRAPPAAFASLLGLAVTHDHASYNMSIGRT